ncbi:MAG TPA: putative sugar O-methyltransferase [Chlamydiales bacterium]|nr:putative sugar O-methyltransferase [Chlamydiales bacterium]
MLKKLLFFFSVFSIGTAAGPVEFSSISYEQGINEACRYATESEEHFSEFRRHLFCSNFIDTLNDAFGWKYIHYVRDHYPDLLNRLTDFQKNEKIGTPYLGDYDHFGFFCPTTFRYIKIAGDLKFLFGNLNQKKIIEIGAGYGGQCRILSELFSFKEYVIIDLPEVLNLAKKYLDSLDVKNVRYIPADQIPSDLSCDLVISNYAFSECSQEPQTVYMQKVLRNSKQGYMICNTLGNKSFNQDTCIEILQKENIAAQVFPELPYSADSNYLLIWK